MRVERKHRHILNLARALYFQERLPIHFLGECVLTDNYLINRTPSLLQGGKTVYELLYGHAPKYNVLRTFGCLCFMHRDDRSKDKFGERSRECIFLGYPHGKRGWRVFDTKTGGIFVSRDVVFLELVFPYQQLGGRDSKTLFELTSDRFVHEDTAKVRGSVEGPVRDTVVHDDTHGEEQPAESSENIGVNSDVVIEASSETLGRGHRQPKLSVLLKDFVTYSARCSKDPVRSSRLSNWILRYLSLLYSSLCNL